ncbi:MAG: carboxylesterase family protein [Pseudomonadota bacterium]
MRISIVAMSKWFASIYAVAALLGCSALHTQTTPVVQTATGLSFQGQWSKEHSRVAQYLGIPFAKPPVGSLRWRAPQPVDATQDVIDASGFGPACMQNRGGVEWYEDVASAFGQAPDVAPQPNGVSEDCLYLNVWAPANQKNDTNKALPILVWIHGGGNTTGWAYEPNYRGAALANEGIIVVSIAYRLGIFGYFSHPDMAADKQIYIANFGLLDQIAALKWIKENAAAFGGDPDNITLAGESAGAGNIGYLLAASNAQKLFTRSIHQSGSFELYDDHTLSDVQQIARTMLEHDPTNSSAGQLADLRSLRAEQLLALADSKYPDAYNYPVADGSVLPITVLDVYEQKKNTPRSMLIGSNEDEWYMYMEPSVTQANIDAWLAEELPNSDHGRINELLAPYDSARSRMDKLVGSQFFRCGGYYMAAKNAEQQGQSWVYHFSRSREGPGGDALRAYHGAEIPYMLNTHDDWLPTGASDIDLTNTMVGYWLNFIKTGNPNGKSLPAWPAYNDKNRVVQKLDVITEPISAPQAELCEFLMPNNNESTLN